MASIVKEYMRDEMKKEMEGESSVPHIRQKEPIELKLNIRDTEFLLRLINNAGVSGSEIEQAYNTFVKLKHFHSVLLNSEIGV